MTSEPDKMCRSRSRLAALASRVKQDKSGSTAIEFAIVALPFLMMIFGTLAVGLFYFTTFALENAVEQAGRLIRNRTSSSYRNDGSCIQDGSLLKGAPLC